MMKYTDVVVATTSSPKVAILINLAFWAGHLVKESECRTSAGETAAVRANPPLIRGHPLRKLPIRSAATFTEYGAKPVYYWS